jgi:hypothetical protein
MKLNKILAAALVAASSASSMAAIIAPVSGNGELTLVMWDAVDKVSYVKDLGLTLDAFTAVSTNSISPYVLNDSFFASFLAIANTTTSDIRFAVVGGDNVNAGGRRIFTTIDNTVTPLTGSLNVSANNYLGNLQSAQNLPSAQGDHDTNLNGSSYAIVGDSVANRYALPNIPTLQNALTGWTTGNVVGTDAQFRSFLNTTTTGTQATQTTFDGLWSVANIGGAATLSYTVAAVPEADGIAMALAGLGALGFVALRRRQS